MNFLTDISSTTSAIISFAMSGSSFLPAGAAPLFAEAASAVSPVDRIVNTAEVLYANAAAITDATAKANAQTLSAQCAAFAAQNGWHGMDTRGPGIIAAIRRNLGETAPNGGAWPDESEDPAPLPRWIIKPATPLVVPEPAAAGAS